MYATPFHSFIFFVTVVVAFLEILFFFLSCFICMPVSMYTCKDNFVIFSFFLRRRLIQTQKQN